MNSQSYTSQRLIKLAAALTLLGTTSMVLPWVLVTDQSEGYIVLGLLMVVLGIYCRIAARGVR